MVASGDEQGLLVESLRNLLVRFLRASSSSAAISPTSPSDATMVSCSSASINRVTVYPRERELIDDHLEAYWGERNAKVLHSLKKLPYVSYPHLDLKTASDICRRRGRDLQRVRPGLLHPEDARKTQTEEATLGVIELTTFFCKCAVFHSAFEFQLYHLRDLVRLFDAPGTPQRRLRSLVRRGHLRVRR